MNASQFTSAFTIQLALKQHGFELHGSTYTWILFNKYSRHFVSAGFSSVDTTNPGLKTIFAFPTVFSQLDFQLGIKNTVFDLGLVDSAEAKGLL